MADLVLELDPTSGPLRAKARGPFTVQEVRGEGVVMLNIGTTGFKEAQSFERHISFLSKYYDQQSLNKS